MKERILKWLAILCILSLSVIPNSGAFGVVGGEIWNTVTTDNATINATILKVQHLTDNATGLFSTVNVFAPNITSAITKTNNSVQSDNSTVNSALSWVSSIYSDLTDNATGIFSVKRFFTPSLTVHILNADNLTVGTIDATNLIVPAGTFVSYTNSLAGVLPTANSWDITPTNLSNTTDGNYSTSTTYGVSNSVAQYGTSGNFLWDLGSVKRFTLRGSVTENVSVTGLYNIFITTTDDFVTYNYPPVYTMNSTANVPNSMSFGPLYCNTRYIILSVMNVNASASKIMFKLYEVEALNDGY